MPCLCEQVTPACPLSPPSPELWINLDSSMEPTTNQPGGLASESSWGFSQSPALEWDTQASCPSCSLGQAGSSLPMRPHLHRVGHWPAFFSPPLLHSQEAGTKTTVPSPPASMQAPGRTGSVHVCEESHFLVDPGLMLFSLSRRENF